MDLVAVESVVGDLGAVESLSMVGVASKTQVVVRAASFMITRVTFARSRLRNVLLM